MLAGLIASLIVVGLVLKYSTGLAAAADGIRAIEGIMVFRVFL